MSLASLTHQLTDRRPDLALAAGWLVLLLVVLAAPVVTRSADAGDDRTRNTVRLALAFYGLAVGLMTRLRPADWSATSGRGRRARLCWSLACLTYLVHVALAFHYHHGWSHRRAMEHVEQVSGFGPGVFVSYLYTLLWSLDVAWWWLRPRGYATRPAWVDRSLHGFMAFVIFNATVVFEQGFIRYAGLTLFALLGTLLLLRRGPR